MHLKLSAHPTAEWAQLFKNQRQFPRHSMWREAWVEGRYIVVDCVPEEIKQYHLRDLNEDAAVVNGEYQIRGVTALHECLRQSLARLMEIYPAVQSHKNEPIFKKLFGVMTDINTLCDLGQKGFLAWKIARKFLPLLTSDASHSIPDAVEVEPVLEEQT